MRQALVLLSASALACSGGVARVSLSTDLAASTLTVPAASVAAGDRVTLERARILVRKATLEGTEDAVVRRGPALVDLSGTDLDAGVRLLFEGEVPAGTYDQLTFQIHKLTPGESVGDPAFGPLGPSVILDLTVDGEPFTFTSDLTAVAVIPGPFTFADGEEANLTLTLDPAGWFTARDGGALDPRLAADRGDIEWNLRASIHGFEDDDLDGSPDGGT